MKLVVLAMPSGDARLGRERTGSLQVRQIDRLDERRQHRLEQGHAGVALRPTELGEVDNGLELEQSQRLGFAPPRATARTEVQPGPAVASRPRCRRADGTVPRRRGARRAVRNRRVLDAAGARHDRAGRQQGSSRRAWIAGAAGGTSAPHRRARAWRGRDRSRCRRLPKQHRHGAERPNRLLPRGDGFD